MLTLRNIEQRLGKRKITRMRMRIRMHPFHVWHQATPFELENNKRATQKKARKGEKERCRCQKVLSPPNTAFQST